jgi:small subunit ribosomal protein S6
LAAPREYELVLMLDPSLDGPARDALAQEARGQIEGSGTLKHENTWGLRKMAYEINRRTEADYRWMRFEAPRELLDTLDHNLKIADGVLRFRIFKVDPAAPVITPPATTASAGPRERSAAPVGAREEQSEAEASHEEPAAAEPTPSPEPAASPEAAASPEPASPESAPSSEPAAPSQPESAAEPAPAAEPAAPSEPEPADAPAAADAPADE